ncbi:MAG: NADP-dependent oxidoreductase, partial [Gammaproteobacteria bacterium]|nr:NADP-dependent oxidoreductase [Gammaproteobacteria bacterium]
MSSRIARQIQMVSRPAGMPGHEHFRIVEVELPAPGAGQVLVENRYMSVDPYMRGRMRAEGVYAAPYPLNAPLYGGAVGEVLESGDENLQPGDIVLNHGAWQDRLLTEASRVQRLEPFDPERISLYLGALGMPGMTAYVGLNRFGEPKEGETVFVSAASGAVGANVCQIAKMKGCRVGSVGSHAPDEYMKEEFCVDAALNNRTCG